MKPWISCLFFLLSVYPDFFVIRLSWWCMRDSFPGQNWLCQSSEYSNIRLCKAHVVSPVPKNDWHENTVTHIQTQTRALTRNRDWCRRFESVSSVKWVKNGHSVTIYYCCCCCCRCIVTFSLYSVAHSVAASCCWCRLHQQANFTIKLWLCASIP